eukprot:11608-Heterococcus_DN1.PRE.2
MPARRQAHSRCAGVYMQQAQRSSHTHCGFALRKRSLLDTSLSNRGFSAAAQRFSSLLQVVELARDAEGTALQAQRQASADWPQPVQQHTFSQDDWYVLQFDGGARGNPGPSGAGAAIFHCALQRGAGADGQDNLALSELVWTSSIYVSDFSTCNEAEYTGMVQGLAAALQLGIKKLLVEGDSQLVVQQVLGRYKVKATNLVPLHEKAVALASKFDELHITHIERALNGHADALANEAMDSRQTTTRGAAAAGFAQ